MRFDDATVPGFADRFVDRIDWAAVDLTEVQRSLLRRRVAELVKYLQRPTFDEYYRLKTEGLHFRFRPAASTEGLARTRAGVPGSGAYDGPRAVSQALWDGTHAGSTRADAPRLAAVCLDRLASGIAHTNTVWTLLKGEAAQPFTKAGEALDPGFDYLSSTDLQPGAPTEPVFFHMSFFARFDHSENVGPVFVSLGWLPQDRAWSLCRMLSDKWLALHTLF
jgi:hypothetical protein